MPLFRINKWMMIHPIHPTNGQCLLLSVRNEPLAPATQGTSLLSPHPHWYSKLSQLSHIWKHISHQNSQNCIFAKFSLKSQTSKFTVPPNFRLYKNTYLVSLYSLYLKLGEKKNIKSHKCGRWWSWPEEYFLGNSLCFYVILISKIHFLTSRG